jgi:hypothetical protein
MGYWEAGVVEQRAGVRPPAPSCRVLGSSLLYACGLWRRRQGPKMGRKIMIWGSSILRYEESRFRETVGLFCDYRALYFLDVF